MASCGSCRADNADGAKFCSECGTPLTVQCVSCGSTVTGRFCSECGTPAAGPTAVSPAQLPPQRTSAEVPALSERRITSVLFGDLVGFTSLSESRDADDVRELLSRYFTVCRTIVERYGGTVEKFIGDAVMAVWGVPVAHEDDAERAVRAGIDVVDAIIALGEEVSAPGLSMRVGVVTGEVAVNVGATGEGMVAGDAVNTASRVQSAAQPGKVWVDDQTRELTAAAVSYEDRGTHELKGKAEPMRLFEARQVVAAVGGARRVDGLEAPFCGRDRELRLVKELFHATIEEGRPRLVAVFGAAGIGKSRLGWEFDKYFDGITDIVRGHRGRCLSYGDGVAFWSLAEMVRGRLGILEGDSNDVALERLREGLQNYVPTTEEQGWLLPRVATLIGIADLVAPDTTFTRDDLFTAWRTFFEHVTHSKESVASVLRIDDLQWADAGLLDFINYLLETAQAPIFVLTLSRPELAERVPAFGSGRRATSLYLEPLPESAMAMLVEGLVAGIPDALRDRLVERADGVPLFAVETVRALIDRDAVIPREGRYVMAPDAAARVDLDDLSLPTSLHTLIASRLDALPAEERRTVQDAAVLGLAFTRPGLLAVRAAVGDRGDPEAVLASLVRKEILSVESDPRSPERGQYRFLQAMVRTVAYEMLARRDRKVRHLAAAGFLAGEPDAETIPAVLASHYLDAYNAAGQDADAQELAARAVELLERAAGRARSVGAHAEARRHLETALGLATDPAITGRLTEAAARAAMASGALNEATALAMAAQEIYEPAGLEVEAAQALALWAETKIAAGSGHPVIDPMIAAFEKLEGRPGADRVTAQLALMIARAYYLSAGDSLSSIPWFERAVVLGEALEDLPLLASTFASYAGALVLVGRSHMGLGLLRVSLELARELGDPNTQVKPLNNLATFLASRDPHAAKSYAEEGLSLSRKLVDREWTVTLISSAANVYYVLGEWDTLLAMVTDEDESTFDVGAVGPLIDSYLASVSYARGVPHEPREMTYKADDAGADAVYDAAFALRTSFVSRAMGDRSTAAEQSRAACHAVVGAAGVDDDFLLFWTTALDDQIEREDAGAAHELLRLVEDMPRGHVPALTRLMLRWQRARVNMLSGQHDAVETDLTAAAMSMQEFGAAFYAARAWLDLATWFVHQGRTQEASGAAARAQQMFSRLDAAPWVARCARIVGSPEQADVAVATPAVPAGT